MNEGLHLATDRRRTGVLCHLSSLPESPGEGALGAPARRLLDFLDRAGCRAWQFLPVGPPAPDGSPYVSISSFAGDEGLLDPVQLREEGLLGSGVPASAAALVAEAHGALGARPDLRQAFETWGAENEDWLDGYCEFVVLRARQDGAPWWQWPEPLRERRVDAMARFRREAGVELERVAVGQFLFARQWQVLHDAARQRDIGLFGDLPMFVAHDSADVWASQALFRLDADGQRTHGAGVPPDYFAATGQLWGMPVYAWDAHRADGFRWWRSRVGVQARRVDWLRIDHFRGFESSWSVPLPAETAEGGSWDEGPGHGLLDLLAASGLAPRLVAEDLGTITAEVAALRDAYGMPGMRVLQFAFNGDPHNPHAPFNHTPGSIVYTGTHDNDTLLGWAATLEPWQRDLACDYLDLDRAADDARLAERVLHEALASVARLCVLPLQDVLGLDGRHRMNTPGTVTGNWGWRVDGDALTDARAEALRTLVSRYGRL